MTCPNPPPTFISRQHTGGYGGKTRFGAVGGGKARLGGGWALVLSALRL